MTEIEVPTEHLHEQLHHEAEHTGGWFSQVALSSAILAALAAVAALLAGHHANEAMIEQIQASDSWSYFQAKGIKSAVLTSKIEMLQSFGREITPKDLEKAEEYKREQIEISERAKQKEESSKHHLHTHEILARGVTFFQISIAVSAISVLSRRRKFWYLSLCFGAIGILSFVQALFF